MILDELATLLASAGVGIPATTLFKHALPPTGPIHGTDPPQIALIEIGGREPVRSHDQPPSRYEQPVVSVIVRSAPHNYPAARQTAQDAWEVLDGQGNVTLSGARYLWIMALRSVHWIRDDELGRSLLGFDVQCARSG